MDKWPPQEIKDWCEKHDATLDHISRDNAWWCCLKIGFFFTQQRALSKFTTLDEFKKELIYEFTRMVNSRG